MVDLGSPADLVFGNRVQKKHSQISAVNLWSICVFAIAMLHANLTMHIRNNERYIIALVKSARVR